VALRNEVAAFYKLRAEQLGTSPSEPVMTQAEKEASTLIPERVGGQGRGPGGGGGGGRGAGTPSKVPQNMTAELNILLGKKKSALEIRDFLSG
jgi:hypothetical protein